MAGGHPFLCYLQFIIIHLYAMQDFLDESEEHKIISEYEAVYLYFKKSDRPRVLIGDFYGDPDGAFISGNEKYIVMFGCGIIIYKIQEPFTDYNYDTPRPQYAEFHRNPGDIWWVESAYECGLDYGDAETLGTQFFRLVMHDDEGKIGVYRMDVNTHKVELLG